MSRSNSIGFEQREKPSKKAPSPSPTMGSLSTLNLPNPNPKPRIYFPARTQISNFNIKASYSPKPKSTTDPQPQPPVLPEKKSLAVATGELFLGFASRLIKNRLEAKGEDINANDENVRMFGDDLKEGENYYWSKKKEGIAAVLEDPVQPEVVWEQRLKDVEAERGRKAVSSPGFSFSAAGLLFPYHLGVAQFLIEKGYIKEDTPLAGSSAGAIVCAVIASGASMQQALEATKILAEDCRLKGTAFRLGVTFISGPVGGSEILWRPRGLLVDQFDSKEDLINAVITSSFIPGYLAPRPATMFRNRLCIDGGLTLFMPPTSAAKTVRVCAFPTSSLGLQGIGISPDCNPENRATPRQLFNWALEPAEDSILDKLFELGHLDAAVWAKDNPVEELVQDSCIEDGAIQ